MLNPAKMNYENALLAFLDALSPWDHDVVVDAVGVVGGAAMEYESPVRDHETVRAMAQAVIDAQAKYLNTITPSQEAT
jgi:hypothetical protein